MVEINVMSWVRIEMKQHTNLVKMYKEKKKEIPEILGIETQIGSLSVCIPIIGIHIIRGYNFKKYLRIEIHSVFRHNW